MKPRAGGGVYSAHSFLNDNDLVTQAGHIQRPGGARRRGTAAAPFRGWLGVPVAACLFVLLAGGCSTERYHAQADKDTYGILSRKERLLFGQTNAFTINTPWSQRALKDIRWEELFGDRKGGAGRKVLSLQDALKIAVEFNRQYQFQKEKLYLTALTLTGERHKFAGLPLGSVGAGVTRESGGDVRLDGAGSLSVSQLLQNGGTISAGLANDLLRYFTGGSGNQLQTVMSLKFTQPLLRGSGADVVAEVLRQSERDVIYELRAYALFQQTFAVDVVTTYYRLLQRKDTVRNAWNNYTKLVTIRELLDAQWKAERRARYEVDQALQEELKGKSAYISSVEAYQTALDQFKITLGFPLGVELALEDAALEDLQKTGLMTLETSEDAAFAAAVDHKLDLLNEIDRFEDSKRKIVVAADSLKADLTFVTTASLRDGKVDYHNFNLSQFTTGAGLQLDLPFDRLLQRNAYRATLITFERSLRSLALTLDTSRDAVRQGLRNLEQLQQNYVIQTNALVLADQRVNATGILLQAGRAQIRDQLEAQTAQVQAQNAVTQVLVDYLATRLKFLVDVGALNTQGEKWWVQPQPLPAGSTPPAGRKLGGADDAVAPPEKVFGN